MIKRCATKAIRILDTSILSQFPDDKPGILIYAFHAIFRNKAEISENTIDPQFGITLDQFAQFVEFYAERGYPFLSPDDLNSRLDQTRRYVMVTFDDGYYNNRLVLPVLRKFDIPSTFFPVTVNVKRNLPFWWDVVYRSGIKNGISTEIIQKEQKFAKLMSTTEREEYFQNNYGEEASIPVGEIDRPFNPDELRAFANDRHVYIGNHTSHHAVLTQCSEQEIMLQITSAQHEIEEMVGTRPSLISYPNGEYSERVISIALAAGLKGGMTTKNITNYFPVDFESMLPFRFGRYNLYQDQSISAQCRKQNAKLTMETVILSGIKKLSRR